MKRTPELLVLHAYHKYGLALQTDPVAQTTMSQTDRQTARLTAQISHSDARQIAAWRDYTVCRQTGKHRKNRPENIGQTDWTDRPANIRQTDWQTKDRQSRKHWTERLANTGRTDEAVV